MAAPWLVKYAGHCSRCGLLLEQGTPAVYDRSTRTIRCIDCPTGPGPTMVAESGVAGRSARAEHDRREAKRDAAIAERWGSGLVAKVVRAVSLEPRWTRAWAIGAAGEEKLARELEAVPGLRMLHDRRAPGTRGNIDHIVVAPAGVFVIDAKNHRGRIAIRDRGGLLRADRRLTVDGRDVSPMADRMAWQVEAVRAAMAEIHPLPPVVPVLCFLNVDWPLIHPPRAFRGVRIESHRSVVRLLTATDVLDQAQADEIVNPIARQLPPR